MALKTNWVASDPGVLGWMNELSTLTNQLTDGTGWRNIASLLVAGSGTATNVQVIRRGTRVTVRMLGATTTNLNLLAGLPVGWRPATNVSFKLLGVDIIVGSAGSINFLTNVAMSALSWTEFSYEAAGAFPTTGLPGVAI